MDRARNKRGGLGSAKEEFEPECGRKRMKEIGGLRKLFSDAFRIPGRNFWKLFAVGGVFSLVVTAVLLPELVWGRETLVWPMLAFLLCFMDAYVSQIVFGELRGESLSIGEASRRGWRIFLRPLANGICLGLLYYGAALVLALCFSPEMLNGNLRLAFEAKPGVMAVLSVILFAMEAHTALLLPYTIHTGRVWIPSDSQKHRNLPPGTVWPEFGAYTSDFPLHGGRGSGSYADFPHLSVLFARGRRSVLAGRAAGVSGAGDRRSAVFHRGPQPSLSKCRKGCGVQSSSSRGRSFTGQYNRNRMNQ